MSWRSAVLLLMSIMTPATLAQTPARSSTAEPNSMSIFEQNLPKDLPPAKDAVEVLLLREYGAVFVARGNVTPPAAIVYRDEAEVAAFRKNVEAMTADFGGRSMTLQAPAMRALLDAVRDADAQGLTISPRDVDAASRSYAEAVDLWASRVGPALDHWTSRRKLDTATAERIRSLTPFGQVTEVLALEKRGIYFAKDLNKSIIYSVAPPGTSQHLSMLAFDVLEHENPRVRDILGKHGWFQTVVSDLPHFTYLGVSEAHLQQLGLKKKLKSGRVFWIPDI